MSKEFESKYKKLWLEVYSSVKALEAGVFTEKQFIDQVKNIINEEE